MHIGKWERVHNSDYSKKGMVSVIYLQNERIYGIALCVLV